MTTTVRFKAKFRGRQVARKDVAVAKPTVVTPERIPRVTRLLALAHRFEKLIRDREVRDYANLARHFDKLGARPSFADTLPPA